VRSELTTWISAPPEAVLTLVAHISRWPERLPHYRYVRILSQSGDETVAAMSARRGPIPVFWHAVQTVDHAAREVRFLHVRGVTRGMKVLWTLEEEDGGTRATIVHDLDLRWPLVGPWVAQHVIEAQFIKPIASLTLRRFKDIAETAIAESTAEHAAEAAATAHAGAGARAAR
jgi:ribosome-associated toxin RatA of RatAB toxin-antitoxin module